MVLDHHSLGTLLLLSSFSSRFLFMALGRIFISFFRNMSVYTTFVASIPLLNSRTNFFKEEASVTAALPRRQPRSLNMHATPPSQHAALSLFLSSRAAHTLFLYPSLKPHKPHRHTSAPHASMYFYFPIRRKYPLILLYVKVHPACMLRFR